MGGGPINPPPLPQLQRPQRIHSVHIGNDGAAFVELLVALGGGDFQVCPIDLWVCPIAPHRAAP